MGNSQELGTGDGAVNAEALARLAKAFASLAGASREELCEPLLGTIASCLGTERCAALLGAREDGGLSVAAARGLTHEELVGGPDAFRFWNGVLEERTLGALSPEDLGRRWPGAPADLASGVAVAPVTGMEGDLGLVVVAMPLGGITAVGLAHLQIAAGMLALALDLARQRGLASSHEERIAELSEALAAKSRLAEQQKARLREMSETVTDALTGQEELASTLEQRAGEAEERARALADKLEIIEQQRNAIRELSTPVLQIWDDVLALPVIGVVDSRRGLEIMERLLEEIQVHQSRFVILDVTGVELVDTKTADHFIKVVKSAELLGAKCIVTGIRPAVAQTLVEIGVDLSTVHTVRNLKEGLRICLRLRQADRAPARATGAARPGVR